MKINNFEYTIGNKKLGKDTLIFNMGPATNCPSKKLGLCKHSKKCYALKAEKMYKATLPFRQRQENFWLTNGPAYKAYWLVQALKKHKGIKFIRFNESGDFTSQRCIEDLIQMTRLVNFKIPGVMFYGYTARQDLDFSNLPDNLTVTGSSFMLDNNFSPYFNVSTHEYISIDRKLDTSEKNNAYMATLKPYDVICKGDCTICNYCKASRSLNIKVAMH